MLNVSWIALLGIGLFVGIANGKTEEIGQALISSATSSVDFTLAILGIVALWSGLMNILNEAGAISFIGRLLYPVLGLFFPEIKHDKDARDNLVSNIAANFLGLGNAATPFGINTVKALQKYAPDKTVASKSVRLFLVTNSAAIQLVPTTIIAMRAGAGATEPSDILLPVWIVSIVSLFVALVSFYVFEFFYGRRKT